MKRYMTAKQIKEKAIQEGLIQLESQREALDAIAGALSQHLLTLEGMDAGMKIEEFPNNSMLVIARTGQGKSELLKRLSRACKLPFAIVDCSSITAEGYKGINLSQAIYAAIQGCANPEEFEQSGGVIFFDEFDKLSYVEDHCDVNPQASFLKLIEKDMPLRADLRSSDAITVDVSRIFFVFAGAFQRLETEMSEKNAGVHVGFLAEDSDKTIDYLQEITMQDIAAHGFLSELLGRIGRLQYIKPLEERDYIALIKGSGNSYQKKYANLFNLRGVKFSISDSACIAIGRDASKESLGARSISPIIDKLLQPAFSRIAEDPTITKVSVVDKNNELTVQYNRAGQRSKDIVAEKTSEGINALDADFSRRICSEKGVAILISEITAMTKFENKIEEIAFNYFLQFCLRYLHLECNPDDQIFNSLVKLSRTTGFYSDESEESIMDILIGDAIKRVPSKNIDSPEEIEKQILNRKDTEKITRMNTFYTLFKSVANNPICEKITSELCRMQRGA